MRILILSDLHLDKPKGELKRFDLEDPIAAIESLAEYTEGVDAAIIAGDIFDSVRIDSTAIHLMRLLDDTLKDIPKKYYIRGNHDRSRFPILDDTYRYHVLNEEPPVEISDSITVSGCDFKDIETHREYLKNAESDILVCHFPLSPFSTFSEFNLSVKDCPENKVVIVGDTHKAEVYTEDNRCVISPGCLFPANKTELVSGTAGTGFILDIRKENGELELDLKPIHVKTRFGADLTSIDSLDGLRHQLETIALREAFPCSLMPVAYIDSKFSDLEYPGVALIPVTKPAETPDGTAVSFSGLEGEGVGDRIRRILATLYAEDQDAEKLVEATTELLMSDAPESVIDSYIGI